MAIETSPVNVLSPDQPDAVDLVLTTSSYQYDSVMVVAQAAIFVPPTQLKDGQYTSTAS